MSSNMFAAWPQDRLHPGRHRPERASQVRTGPQNGLHPLQGGTHTLESPASRWWLAPRRCGRRSYANPKPNPKTLTQDPSSGSYEQKMTRFVMRQRLGKSKKKVGEVEIDLAKYATMEEPRGEIEPIKATANPPRNRYPWLTPAPPRRCTLAQSAVRGSPSPSGPIGSKTSLWMKRAAKDRMSPTCACPANPPAPRLVAWPSATA